MLPNGILLPVNLKQQGNTLKEHKELSYIWRAISNRCAASTDKLLEGYPLTQTDRMVLMNINVLKKASKTKIAESNNICQQNLTRSIARLLKNKYIKKNPCKTDKRKSYLTLTEKSIPILEKLEKHNLQLWKKMTGTFSPTEKEAFAEKFKQLLENLLTEEGK